MRVKVLQGRVDMDFFASLIFLLGKRVECKNPQKVPLVIDIQGGNDEDLQKLTDAGFVVEKDTP